MIKFYANRKIFAAISGTIFLIGIICYFINGGLQLDIQFKGGSIIKYDYVGEIDTERADQVVSEALARLATCQATSDLATNSQKLVINLAGDEGLASEEQSKLDDALKAEFPEMNLQLSESSIVEPFIGRRFLTNGLIAIALSFALIILYVWYSFRKIGGLSAGTMALVALVHDVIVVLIAFIVFRIPINENFIAAALSIIGFSINDTIVIYDRIRENMKMSGSKLPIEELVDKSINQSLSRSLNTNIAVFVSIAMVFVFAQIFAISSIQSFALPMMLGVVSGCYSTICIAGPLWVMWKKHSAKRSFKRA